MYQKKFSSYLKKFRKMIHVLHICTKPKGGFKRVSFKIFVLDYITWHNRSEFYLVSAFNKFSSYLKKCSEMSRCNYILEDMPRIFRFLTLDLSVSKIYFLQCLINSKHSKSTSADRLSLTVWYFSHKFISRDICM